MVGGELLVEGQHIVVAAGFCEDGCCCDAHVFGITFDYGGEGDVVIWLEAVAVYDEGLRAERELV